MAPPAAASERAITAPISANERSLQTRSQTSALSLGRIAWGEVSAAAVGARSTTLASTSATGIRSSASATQSRSRRRTDRRRFLAAFLTVWTTRAPTPSGRGVGAFEGRPRRGPVIGRHLLGCRRIADLG